MGQFCWTDNLEKSDCCVTAAPSTAPITSAPSIASTNIMDQDCINLVSGDTEQEQRDARTRCLQQQIRVVENNVADLEAQLTSAKQSCTLDYSAIETLMTECP